MKNLILICAVLVIHMSVGSGYKRRSSACNNNNNVNCGSHSLECGKGYIISIRDTFHGFTKLTRKCPTNRYSCSKSSSCCKHKWGDCGNPIGDNQMEKILRECEGYRTCTATIPSSKDKRNCKRPAVYKYINDYTEVNYRCIIDPKTITDKMNKKQVVGKLVVLRAQKNQTCWNKVISTFPYYMYHSSTKCSKLRIHKKFNIKCKTWYKIRGSTNFTIEANSDTFVIVDTQYMAIMVTTVCNSPDDKASTGDKTSTTKSSVLYSAGTSVTVTTDKKYTTTTKYTGTSVTVNTDQKYTTSTNHTPTTDLFAVSEVTDNPDIEKVFEGEVSEHNQNDNNKVKNAKLNIGIPIGISIAGLIIVALVIVIVVLLIKRGRPEAAKPGGGSVINPVYSNTHGGISSINNAFENHVYEDIHSIRRETTRKPDNYNESQYQDNNGASQINGIDVDIIKVPDTTTTANRVESLVEKDTLPILNYDYMQDLKENIDEPIKNVDDSIYSTTKSTTDA